MFWDTIVQVSGSDATTTNSTATDITGLTYPAVGNSIYEIEVVLFASSSTSAGCQYAVAFSDIGAAGSVMTFANKTLKSSGGEAYSNLGTLESTAFLTIGGSTQCEVRIAAFVNTGVTSGNITAQHAKITSGTSTVYVGSVMKIRRML